MRTLFGTRLVTCPETGRIAAVRFNRFQALAAVIEGGHSAELAQCSRWRERGRCDQPCMPQAHLPDSLVEHMVARWSAERQCAFCNKPVVEGPLVGHHICLRTTDGVTHEWPEFPPESLPEVLRASQAVCWNCHISETLRRRYAHLIVDR